MYLILALWTLVLRRSKREFTPLKSMSGIAIKCLSLRFGSKIEVHLLDSIRALYFMCISLPCCEVFLAHQDRYIQSRPWVFISIYLVHVSKDHPVEFKLLRQKVCWARITDRRPLVLYDVSLETFCIARVCHSIRERTLQDSLKTKIGQKLPINSICLLIFNVFKITQ